MRTQHFVFANQNSPHSERQPRHLPGAACLGLAVAIALSLSSSDALAGCGDTGGGQGVSGSESAELAQRFQEETIEKAKARAGLASIPIFAGASVSASWLNHDGFKLKKPVTVTTPCLDPPTVVDTVTKMAPFETNTQSASVLGEVDLARTLGLPRGHLFKLGAAIGGKWLETKTDDITIGGKSTGPARLEEDGVQVDLYSLLAIGPSYAIVAASFGSGDSDLTNTSADTKTGVIGRGKTDYRDVIVSVTLGHVLTLDSSANTRTLLDISGGLMWSSYTRDAFTDSRNTSFSDANTDEFAGKVEVKLAYQMLQGANAFTPYIKGGVKHRFDYDSSFTVLQDDKFDFSGPFIMTSDDTFWRAGGGLGISLDNGNVTGVVDGTYQASGDSNEFIGRAQLIFKLN